MHGAVARRTDRPHPSSGSPDPHLARLFAVHDPHHRYLFPAHSAGFHPGVGTRSELQRRNRNRLGTLQERGCAGRTDPHRRRTATVAHGLRAGAHRRRQTLGCTRRHPRPGQRNIQGEQPRNPLGGAFQGRTGPDRRQGDGEGQGREKGVSGIGRSGHEPHEYRWRHDGRLHRQEPQLRGLLRGRSRRRDQSTHSYRAQDERDDGRLVRQGLAGPAAGRGASAAAGRTVRPLRPQHPLLEHHRPAARELPQLRPAAGPLRQSTADVQRRERDDALRDQNILSEFIRHNDAPFIYEKSATATTGS